MPLNIIEAYNTYKQITRSSYDDPGSGDEPENLGDIASPMNGGSALDIVYAFNEDCQDTYSKVSVGALVTMFLLEYDVDCQLQPDESLTRDHSNLAEAFILGRSDISADTIINNYDSIDLDIQLALTQGDVVHLQLSYCEGNVEIYQVKDGTYSMLYSCYIYNHVAGTKWSIILDSMRNHEVSITTPSEYAPMVMQLANRAGSINISQVNEVLSNALDTQELLMGINSLFSEDSTEVSISDAFTLIGDKVNSQSSNVQSLISSIKAFGSTISLTGYVGMIRSLMSGLFNSNTSQRQIQWGRNVYEVQNFNVTVVFEAFQDVATTLGSILMMIPTAATRIIGGIMLVGGLISKGINSAVDSIVQGQSSVKLNQKVINRLFAAPYAFNIHYLFGNLELLVPGTLKYELYHTLLLKNECVVHVPGFDLFVRNLVVEPPVTSSGYTNLYADFAVYVNLNYNFAGNIKISEGGSEFDVEWLRPFNSGTYYFVKPHAVDYPERKYRLVPSIGVSRDGELGLSQQRTGIAGISGDCVNLGFALNSKMISSIDYAINGKRITDADIIIRKRITNILAFSAYQQCRFDVTSHLSGDNFSANFDSELITISSVADQWLTSGVWADDHNNMLLLTKLADDSGFTLPWDVIVNSFFNLDIASRFGFVSTLLKDYAQNFFINDEIWVSDWFATPPEYTSQYILGKAIATLAIVGATVAAVVTLKTIIKVKTRKLADKALLAAKKATTAFWSADSFDSEKYREMKWASLKANLLLGAAGLGHYDYRADFFESSAGNAGFLSAFLAGRANTQEITHETDILKSDATVIKAGQVATATTLSSIAGEVTETLHTSQDIKIIDQSLVLATDDIGEKCDLLAGGQTTITRNQAVITDNTVAIARLIKPNS